MSKSATNKRQERISSFDDQIAKLQEKRNAELEKQKKEEKIEREKRQRSRGEALEKLMPETIELTVEQFATFLRRSTANVFGRDKLAEILREGEAKVKSTAIEPKSQSAQKTETLKHTQQSEVAPEAPNHPKPTKTAQSATEQNTP